MLPNTLTPVQTGISAPDIGPRISAEGRYVVFSANQILLPVDTTPQDGDIYIKDLLSGELRLVSTSNTGPLASVKASPSMNADGTLIAFQNNDGQHVAILARNMFTGQLISASSNAAGVEANGHSYNSVVSGDGTAIAYISKATNLTATDTNEQDDVFIKDLRTGAVFNAATTAAGVQADADSTEPALSGNGQLLAFTTYAGNLTAGDDSYADIYAKNVIDGSLTRVSANSAGVGANGNSDGAAISADGRYIVFASQASNLVAGDTNDHRDVFRKDMVTGETVRVSTTADGKQGAGDSIDASISSDGRYVVFDSTSNLTPGDGNGKSDIFIKDMLTGALSRLSQDAGADYFNYLNSNALAANSLDVVFTNYQFINGTLSDPRTLMHAKPGAGFGDTAPVSLSGTADAETLISSQGADILSGLGGNDLIDGGGGIDQAVYTGNRANYTINATASTGVVITDNSGADGVDTLGNVERLHFPDADLALDVDGSGGQAYRLYQAAFNRTPDLPGLGYWIAMLDQGLSVDNAAASFLGSAEGQALYGANPSNADLVTRLYDNVLHRAPDAGGQAFWLDVLNSGAASQAAVLASFSESAENQTALIGVLQNGFAYTPYG